MTELTESVVHVFADVMLRKAEMNGEADLRLRRRAGRSSVDDVLRGIIENVIVDTELLLSGAVPLARWLDPLADG